MSNSTTLRNIILDKIYSQCLKLLDPMSVQYQNENPNLTPPEQNDIESIGERCIEYVTFKKVSISNLQKRELLPSIIIERASDGFLVNRTDVPFNKLAKIMPFAVKLINGPETENIPRAVNTIADQFEHVLNVKNFRNMKAERVGCTLPDLVIDSYIAGDQNLQGDASLYEITLFRFEVIFSYQKELD